jgi:hypothetical protein
MYAWNVWTAIGPKQVITLGFSIATLVGCGSLNEQTTKASNGLFSTTTCKSEPNATILHRDIDYSYRQPNQSKYRVHRANNDDVIVQDIENECYFSISSNTEQPLEFPEDLHRAGVWNEPSYRNTVLAAERRFLGECPSTASLSEKLRIIEDRLSAARHASGSSKIVLEQPLPCSLLLADLSISLIFSDKSGDGSAGGLTIINNETIGWVLRSSSP